MKNLKYILFLAIFMIASCGEEDVDVYDQTGPTDTDEFPVITFGDISTTYTYPPSPAGTTDEVLITVAVATSPRSTDIPYTITVTESDASIFSVGQVITGAIPAGELSHTTSYTLELDDLVLGQPNTTTMVVESDGFTQGARKEVTLTFGLCPTALAGEYSAVAVGNSTDGCCPDETTTALDVTVTDLGGAMYQVSDFSAGMYFTWYAVYGITEDMQTNGVLNGTFTDACDVLNGVFPEPFSTDVTLTGSVDTSTGVITYTWVNGYDDTATVVLTPK